MLGLDDVEEGELMMLNQLLLTYGIAQYWSYPPDVVYQDSFIADQRQALENSIGL